MTAIGDTVRARVPDVERALTDVRNVLATLLN